MAAACTSLVATPCSLGTGGAVVELGLAVHHHAPRRATLMRTSPYGVATDTISRRQALALPLGEADADGGRLAEQHVDNRVLARRRHQHRHQRARAALLHLHRDEEHLERAGVVELVHHRAEQLRVHVVDLAFDDEHAIAVGPPSAASPTSTRSTLGVSANS